MPSTRPGTTSPAIATASPPGWRPTSSSRAPRPSPATPAASVMIELDHIAVIAPSLAAGVAYVHDVLGVEPVTGGKHSLMGTHNCLLRIGEDVFMEVIAIDPDAPQPAVKRWFGLDDQVAVQRNWQSGHRLGAY